MTYANDLSNLLSIEKPTVKTAIPARNLFARSLFYKHIRSNNHSLKTGHLRKCDKGNTVNVKLVELSAKQKAKMQFLSNC